MIAWVCESDDDNGPPTKKRRGFLEDAGNSLETSYKDFQPLIEVTAVRKVSEIPVEGMHASSSDNKLTQLQSTYIWRKLAPSVCQNKCLGAEGTGSMVGSLQDNLTNLPHRYVLTCYHLKLQDAFLNSQQCTVEFGFNKLNAPPAVSVNINPTIIACNADLDYILVRLDHSQSLEDYLRNAPPLGPLIAKTNPGNHDPLILIGHPDGKQKKLDPGVCSVSSLYLNRQPDIIHAVTNGWGRNLQRLKDDNYQFYHCHSFQGASGSPCFSVHKKLLYSMHCGGVFIGPNVTYGVKSYVEYGVSLLSVLKDIKAQIQMQYFSPQGPMLKIPGELYALFPQLR